MSKRGYCLVKLGDKMTEEKELNEKLARWAGFERADIKKHYYWEGCERLPKWREPNTGYHIKLPSFTNSEIGIACCFKWLVPKSKMDVLWIVNNLDGSAPSIKFCFGFGRGADNDLICWSKNLPPNDCLSPMADTPALALCLAIEKLINEH